MFKNQVIDRSMNGIMQNFKINADQNVGHSVKSTFVEGKFGRFLM